MSAWEVVEIAPNDPELNFSSSGIGR